MKPSNDQILVYPHPELGNAVAPLAMLAFKTKGDDGDFTVDDSRAVYAGTRLKVGGTDQVYFVTWAEVNPGGCVGRPNLLHLKRRLHLNRSTLNCFTL